MGYKKNWSSLYRDWMRILVLNKFQFENDDVLILMVSTVANEIKFILNLKLLPVYDPIIG